MEDVLDPNISGYGFELSLLGLVPDLLPVGLVVALEGLDTELPWSSYPCLLFHAVGVGAIVNHDGLEVGLSTELLECTELDRIRKVDVELDVPGALFTLLELSTDVGGPLSKREQVLLRIHIRIVECA